MLVCLGFHEVGDEVHAWSQYFLDIVEVKWLWIYLVATIEHITLMQSLLYIQTEKQHGLIGV